MNTSAMNVVYSSLGYGLGAWVGLAKSIRIATRSGNTFPIATTGNGQYVDTSKATSYYLVMIHLTSRELEYCLQSWFFRYYGRYSRVSSNAALYVAA